MLNKTKYLIMLALCLRVGATARLTTQHLGDNSTLFQVIGQVDEMQVTRSFAAPGIAGTPGEIDIHPEVAEALLLSRDFGFRRLSIKSSYLNLFHLRRVVPDSLWLNVRGSQNKVILRIDTDIAYALEVELDMESCGTLTSYLNSDNPEIFNLLPNGACDPFDLIDVYFFPTTERVGSLTRSVGSRFQYTYAMVREAIRMDPESVPQAVREFLDLTPEFGPEHLKLEILPKEGGSEFRVRFSADTLGIPYLQSITRRFLTDTHFNSFSGRPDDLNRTMENFLLGQYVASIEPDKGSLADLHKAHEILAASQFPSDFIMTVNKGRKGVIIVSINPVYDSGLKSALEFRFADLPADHNLMTWIGKDRVPLDLEGTPAYCPGELRKVYLNATIKNIEAFLELIRNVPEYSEHAEYPTITDGDMSEGDWPDDDTSDS